MTSPSPLQSYDSVMAGVFLRLWDLLMQWVGCQGASLGLEEPWQTRDLEGA